MSKPELNDEDDYTESGTPGPGVGKKNACQQCGIPDGLHTRDCVTRKLKRDVPEPKKNPITRGARNPKRRKS